MGEPLGLAHLAPAEARVPADRLVDEGREDVAEIVVGDLEAAVLRVHARQRPASALAAVAVLHQLADNDVGIVVAFLRAMAEFAGRVEKTGYARHAEGAEQCEFERARRVEREIVAGAQKNDALVIALRVERPNPVKDRQAPHQRLSGEAGLLSGPS